MFAIAPGQEARPEPTARRHMAGVPQRGEQLPPPQQRAKPDRNCDAAHCPESSALKGAHQAEDDIRNRHDNRPAQAPPRGAQSLQARAGAGAGPQAYGVKHLRYEERICWAPDRAQQPAPQPPRQRH